MLNRNSGIGHLLTYAACLILTGLITTHGGFAQTAAQISGQQNSKEETTRTLQLNSILSYLTTKNTKITKEERNILTFLLRIFRALRG
jgi:hypothetical protein